MTYDKGDKKIAYKKTTAKTGNKTVYNPKRGKLAPLMTEEAKATAGIHELSYDFGCK